jgi:hypothetical protein
MGPAEYLISKICKENHDKTIHGYQCKVCGHIFDGRWNYRYSPENCPQHQWEFTHREFRDAPHKHSIVMVFQCDRCGAEKTRGQDTKEAGISGRVEIDHPLVAPTLALNKSVAKRILDQDAIKDFWKYTDDDLIMGKPNAYKTIWWVK